MTKHDLLDYFAEVGSADAADVAGAFALEYPAAAMALLRLTRQGLLQRYADVDRGSYFYELTERGRERLAFLRRDS